MNLGRAGLYLGQAQFSMETSFRPVLTSSLIADGEVNISELIACLEQLNQEEPTLDLEWDVETKQIKVKVMGPVQMEILEDLVWRRFGYLIKLANPEVNYLETVAATSQGFCHFEPQETSSSDRTLDV